MSDERDWWRGAVIYQIYPRRFLDSNGDAISPPNNWQSVFTIPARTWDARRQQYYMHNFLAQQPDLNLHNVEVQDALLDVARFRLDRGIAERVTVPGRLDGYSGYLAVHRDSVADRQQ